MGPDKIRIEMSGSAPLRSAPSAGIVKDAVCPAMGGPCGRVVPLQLVGEIENVGKPEAVDCGEPDAILVVQDRLAFPMPSARICGAQDIVAKCKMAGHGFAISPFCDSR
jgi:hypothetical protein